MDEWLDDVPWNSKHPSRARGFFLFLGHTQQLPRAVMVKDTMSLICEIHGKMSVLDEPINDT